MPAAERDAVTEAIRSDSSGLDTVPSHTTWTIDNKPLSVISNVHSPSGADASGSIDRNGATEEPTLPHIPIKEPELCQEQAELVDIILSGRNVFYTGSAGCGKSTVLKAFTRCLRDRGYQVDIVAPTGISALGVGGSTTFVYAGWNLSTLKQPIKKVRLGAHGKHTRKRLKATDVLVIDEISMVENFHFERLNIIMQEARNSLEPFGGAQVVVTGDFHQLPPVKPFEHCLTCGEELVANRSEELYTCKNHGIFHDEDKWAFKSEAWALCDFVYFHLKTIHRQNDETFIRILQKCRIGQPLMGDETDLLMNHPCATANATKLYARREEVRRENQKRFGKLLSEKFSFPCLDYIDINPDHNLHEKYTWRAPDGSLDALKDHRYESLVEFKKGMLVVLLTNLDLSQKLCNGSQGLICGYEEFDPQKLPKKPSPNRNFGVEVNSIYGDYAELREMWIRRFIERKEITKKVWPIVRFHNGVVRTIYADCSIHTLGNKEPYTLLMRTQIPLAPAWASKSFKSFAVLSHLTPRTTCATYKLSSYILSGKTIYIYWTNESFCSVNPQEPESHTRSRHRRPHKGLGRRTSLRCPVPSNELVRSQDRRRSAGTVGGERRELGSAKIPQGKIWNMS
jgi:ATP-dependent DNA helicase PIF1